MIYNIETTNACNMRREMCPRTTMMTRPVEAMAPELFKKVIDQLKPFTHPEQLDRWEKFVVKNYGIGKDDMSENHYSCTSSPGDRIARLWRPLLDKNMPQYVNG